MKTVQLIVTGRLEQLALHHSLERLFGGAKFLEPLRLDGYTSAHVPATPAEFLCTDPQAADDVKAYRETIEGVAALNELDWRGALAAPSHAQFARSLIDDVADCLGTSNPCPGTCARETSRSPGGLLRNLG